MVRIDGAKIRHLRESKGLTQLYIATAVEVTTDTVSRWENKRYPSIKKENGLRLAEALEVSLEEILESEHPAAAPVEPGEMEGSEAADAPPPPRDAVGPALSRRRKTALRKALPAFLLLLAAALFSLYRWYHSEGALTEITVRRTVPAHFIAGQPLPVFLHIMSPGSEPGSIILREELPPGTVSGFAFPELSGKAQKDRSLKWLAKVSGAARFSYTVTSDPNFQGQLNFTGTLKMAARGSVDVPVSGDGISTAGLYHWADSNRDNRISDEEILAVYDLVDPETGSGIDMDQIEEMWLGDGYIWDPREQRLSIVE